MLIYISYQNCTDYLNPCYCVTHNKSIQFHSSNLYIEAAFDPPLTMKVLQPLFSLIPFLLI